MARFPDSSSDIDPRLPHNAGFSDFRSAAPLSGLGLKNSDRQKSESGDLEHDTVDTQNNVHCRIFPADGDGRVRRLIQQQRYCKMQTGTILLHYHTGCYIFERLLER
jgi:hypothetical protein